MEKLNKDGLNKPAFQMYNKYIHQIEELTDEEAGKLMKHIFRYVNDLNPPDLEDRLLKIVFTNIKQDLKNDLEKYIGIVKQRKTNGSKGGIANAKKNHNK